MSQLIGNGECCIVCDQDFISGQFCSENCYIEEVIEGYKCFVHNKCTDFIHNVTHCNKNFFEQVPKNRETALSIINKARETYFRNISQQKKIDYLRKFVSFICDKTLTVIVNGEDYTFNAIGNETVLELKTHILHESRFSQPKEQWELLRQSGVIIGNNEILNELNIPKSEKLVLSLKLHDWHKKDRSEGEIFFVSTPHPAHVDKNFNFFPCEAWNKEMKKMQSKSKDLFVNEYSCVPVAANISMSSHSLSNEEIKESYKKARMSDRVLSVASELDYLNSNNIQAFTPDHKLLTKDGFKSFKEFSERTRDLVSFVTEPADKIGYGRKHSEKQNECDTKCGYRRLPIEEQEKYVSNFKEESVTFRIYEQGKQFCQECFDLISYYPIESEIESVVDDIVKSISFVDRMFKYYSTFSHLSPISIYQARRAFCEARIQGLSIEQIESEIRSRLSNCSSAKKQIELEKCDCCEGNRLSLSDQKAFVNSFKENSIVHTIDCLNRYLCGNCWELASLYPTLPVGSKGRAFSAMDVIHDLKDSAVLQDKILEYYDLDDNPPTRNRYIARRSFHQARIDGLETDKIVMKLDEGIINMNNKKAVIGKADEAFEKQRDEMIENENKFFETTVFCPICERGTVSAKVTGDFCAACYDLKMNYCDPQWTDKWKDEELKKSFEYYKNQKSSNSEYALRRKYLKMKYDPFIKCKICGEETNSKHITYCDECIQLKQQIIARYKRFDEKYLDNELNKSLEYYKQGVQNGNTSPRYDTRLYFLELPPVYSEEKCCVCSSDIEVMKYNEKYPLCVSCATLYECCSKSLTNERAIEELKKSLVFAKSKEGHEEEITFEARREWLHRTIADIESMSRVPHFEEYRDNRNKSQEIKVFTDSVSGVFSSWCPICMKDLPKNDVPTRFKLSHSSILLETKVHTQCSEHIRYVIFDDLSEKFVEDEKIVSTIEDAKNILSKAREEYLRIDRLAKESTRIEKDLECQNREYIKVVKDTQEKCKEKQRDYFEMTKGRKDPISFYGNYDNPDACIICGNACDKEKKIIDTPYGFRIAIRAHENHLKFINVHELSLEASQKDDYEKAKFILNKANSQFKTEYVLWLEEQGNNKKTTERKEEYRAKKSTNEIKMFGTGDLNK
jgi:hypothetical protein